MRIDLSGYGGRRVLVLGATGMIGSAVCRLLEGAGAAVGKVSRSLGCDARDRLALGRVFDQGYELCVNLAGWNGGIGTNATHPAAVYLNNAQIALNAVEACAERGVEFLGVLASCGYPDVRDGLLYESTYLAGRPHESVACHGMAKRAMLEACRFASRQYPAGKFRCVCVPTVFGPGDHYEGERTKVVGAMVKRMCGAADRGEASVTCWGTGNPLREVMYVKDAAALIAAAALADSAWDGPLNLSTRQEFSVRQIAEGVAAAAGYRGRIEWDEGKPDGQMRKRLDATRMAALFPSFEPTPFADALVETVFEYRRSR